MDAHHHRRAARLGGVGQEGRQNERRVEPITGTAGQGYIPSSHTNTRGRVVCEDCNKDYANRRTFLKYANFLIFLLILILSHRWKCRGRPGVAPTPPVEAPTLHAAPTQHAAPTPSLFTVTLPIPDDMEIEILAEEEDVDFLEEFSLEEMSVSQVTVMLCDF